MTLISNLQNTQIDINRIQESTNQQILNLQNVYKRLAQEPEIQSNHHLIIDADFMFPINYVIKPYSIVKPGVTIPSGVIISDFVTVEKNVHIKSDVHIKSKAFIHPGVMIETGAIIEASLPHGIIWLGIIHQYIPLKDDDFIHKNSTITTRYLPEKINVPNTLPIKHGTYIGTHKSFMGHIKNKKSIHTLHANINSDVGNNDQFNGNITEILAEKILPGDIILPNSIIDKDVVISDGVHIMDGVTAYVGAKLPTHRGYIKWIGDVETEDFLQNKDEIITRNTDQKSTINCPINKEILIEQNVYIKSDSILSKKVILNNLIIIDTKAKINCVLPLKIQWFGNNIDFIIRSGDIVLENSSVNAKICSGATLQKNVTLMKNVILCDNIKILGHLYINGNININNLNTTFPITFFDIIDQNQTIKSNNIVACIIPNGTFNTIIKNGVIIQNGVTIESNVLIDKGVQIASGVNVSINANVNTLLPNGIRWTGDILPKNLSKIKSGDIIVPSASVTTGSLSNNYYITGFVTNDTILKPGNILDEKAFVIYGVTIPEGIKIKKGVYLSDGVKFNKKVTISLNINNIVKKYTDIESLNITNEIFGTVEEEFIT